MNNGIIVFLFITIGQNNFYEILVDKLQTLLEQRERVHPTHWVLTEALSAKSLRMGGTFQNTLARKFDYIITPLFAEIIAVIDQNYNLNILDVGDLQSPLSQFWLQIFGDQNIISFLYEDVINKGTKDRKSQENFHGKFPFSWIVHDKFTSTLATARVGTYDIIICMIAYSITGIWKYD